MTATTPGAPPLRLRAYGEHAVIVEPDAVSPAELAARLRATAGPGEPGLVVHRDLVPAERSVTITFDDDAAPPAIADLAAWVTRALSLAGVAASTPATTHTVPMRYDGEDLADVAAAAGLTPAEVVARHAAVTYTAAFAGFAPGFVYLTGLDPALHLPRRPDPRTSVPTGSIAVASHFTAAYPRSSPGGWHLIGRTDAVLFDAQRDPAALIRPGDRVRFTPEPGGGRTP